MKLIELLKQAKQQGMIYCNIPFNCGIDEAIMQVNAQLKNDAGFKENQLTTLKKDNMIIFEIRKKPNAKRAFSVKCWK